MQTFTGWQYLLIDAANNCGKDKLTFDERIQWAEQNLSHLESFAEDKYWKERPLYIKAVAAIRRAQRGEPIGHLVGVDAVCSGMQIMSALTGCENGAKATGLIDSGKRPDAYTECTKIMNSILGYSDTVVPRDDIKQATMTALYGSKAEPRKIFGDEAVELNAFYRALYKLAPGACDLLQALLDSWNSGALVHAWKMPDGFDVRIKVIQSKETRVEVDELNHASFTYQYYVNEGEEKGVKNAANGVHAVDGYVLRSLVRRCNYDRELVEWASDAITKELIDRELGYSTHDVPTSHDPELNYYLEQYNRSSVADVVIFNAMYDGDAKYLSTKHLRQLAEITETMLEHKPFPVVTVHDDFRAHPNNVNWVRKHYRDILAELADSELLTDIMQQLYKIKGTYPKRSTSLSKHIRQSNYALT